jgi:deoxyribodipyrimidine photolyase-related protein
MVLVEPDLFLRQLPFHTPQARAAPGVDEGLRGTAARAGLPTSYVASSADHPSDARLVEVLARHPVSRLEVYDVVDDWRGRNLQQVARLAGAELTVHETPAFLTPRTPSCGRWPQAPGGRGCSTSTNAKGAGSGW